jgi:hypothetical protein
MTAASRVPFILLAAVLLAGCGQSTAPPSKVAQGAEFLTRMPLNAEERCVGICAVIAALCDGTLDATAAAEPCDQLAQRVVDHVPATDPFAYPATVILDKQRRAIDDPEVLEALSVRVAERYKERHRQLAASQAGILRLRLAAAKTVVSQQELEELLDADHDHIVAFMAEGQREFDDGASRPTSHAVLLRKDDQGDIVVYDPNDPGLPIACTLIAEPDGFKVQWTCAYQHQAARTTQTYSIVSQPQYFRVLRDAR